MTLNFVPRQTAKSPAGVPSAMVRAEMPIDFLRNDHGRRPAPARPDGPPVRGQKLALSVGQVVHRAGVFADQVWLVDEGALRLDLPSDGTERFVQLALKGDHLGVESLCGLPTMYCVTSITNRVLQPQSVGCKHERRAASAAALVRLWCRAADQIALRTGSAGERLRQLLLMLAAGGEMATEGSTPVALPRLTDIAAIVDTAPETVSRILSAWRRQDLLHGAGASSARIDLRRLAAYKTPNNRTRAAGGASVAGLHGSPWALDAS
jgi:CRP-like cAMP-binding protein